MKRIGTFLSILITLTTIQSCNVLSPIRKTAIDFDTISVFKTGIIQRPLVTDLEVAPKKVYLTKSFDGMSIVDAKANTTGAFIIENKCDLIVQPNFVVKSVEENSKRTITVSLSGYPSYYRNIRNYEPKDSLAFLIKSTSNSIKVPVISNSDTVITSDTSKMEIAKVPKEGKHKLKFGISIDYGFPFGDLNDKFLPGIGYGIHFIIPLNKNNDLTINTVSNGFKNRSDLLNNGSSIFISETVGFKHNISKGFYFEPKLGGGYYSQMSSVGINYVLGAGYNVTKDMDVTIKYDKLANFDGLNLGFWGISFKRIL